jgi:hypothetical protein
MEDGMNPTLRRHASTFAIALGAALAAALAHQFIMRVPPSTSTSYFVSEWLESNYFALITQAVLIAVGYHLAYRWHASPWVVGVAMMLPFPVATFYEITLDRTSHNMLPFEIIVWVPLVALPTIGALVGRMMLRRRHTQA